MCIRDRGSAGRPATVLLGQAGEAGHAGRVPGSRAGRPEGHLLRRRRERRAPGQDAHREDGAGEGLRRAAVHEGDVYKRQECRVVYFNKKMEVAFPHLKTGMPVSYTHLSFIA